MDGQGLKALRNRMELSRKKMVEKLYITESALIKLELDINKMSKPVAAHAEKLKIQADQDDYLASHGLQ